MKTLITHYRINRSWGDSVAEAFYWALRGKSFPELLNLDLDDKWEDYRRVRHETFVAMGVRPAGSHHDEYLDDGEIYSRIYNYKGDK